MAQPYAEMTVRIHPEMTDEGKEMLRQMIREELFKMQLERQSVQAWIQLEEGGAVEIDYSRYDEFRRWLSQNKDQAPKDATSQSDLVEKIDALYVAWLKQQQKPAHLNFEAK